LENISDDQMAANIHFVERKRGGW